MTAALTPTVSEQKKNCLYLGSVVCNISGDIARLYLRNDTLEAEIENQKREIILIPSGQIRGGRDGEMPFTDLIKLIKSVTHSVLFAVYQPEQGLQIFVRNFHEVQKNIFLKPRIQFPSYFFSSVQRNSVLKSIRQALLNYNVLTLVKDSKLPLQRVGKTELAHQYLQEYRAYYSHVFWIQSFDPWFFQKDLEDMADQLQIQVSDIPQFIANNSSSLVIFDGLENPLTLDKYLPKSSHQGHILITSRQNAWEVNTFEIGLLEKEESATFFLQNAQGTPEKAASLAQSLGYVPSSLYRALETIVIENLSLSDYSTFATHQLDHHANRMTSIPYNIPARNKDFIGREANLVALEECFSENKPVVLAANAGLGGVGKTQIALQYAYRTTPQYNLIWWIDTTNITISYADLAKRLGIYLTDEEKMKEHAIIKKVNTYLELNPGWLLIFDNVENENHIKGLHPNSGGHILITSRNPQWDFTQVEVFKVGVFERQESIQFILKVTSLYDQETAANNLANTLQDLPLALAQATAYIKETGISIEAYIDDFNKWHIELWDREKPTNNYKFTVNVTWNISMKKIQEIEAKEDNVCQPIAMPLMQFCSFFAPNDIPRDLLILEWLKAEYLKNHRETVTCLSDLSLTLSLLDKYSMVDLQEETISIHSLVQTVTIDQLPSEQVRAVCTMGVRLIDAQFIFDKNRLDQIQKSTPLIKHTESICRHALHLEVEPLLSANLMQKMHRFLYKQGLFHEAKKVCSQLITFREEKKINEDHRMAIVEISHVAEIERRLGNICQAKSLCETALTLIKDIKEEVRPILSTLYTNYGNIWFMIGEFDKAEEYYQKSLAIDKEIHGESHVEVAADLCKLGDMWNKRDDPEKALSYHSQALEMIEEEYGDNHPDYTVYMNNLGDAWNNHGDLLKALKHYEKALDANKKIYGDKHPEVAANLNNIATIYHKKHEYEHALSNYLEALKIDEQAFGEEHLEVAKDCNNIGALLIEWDKLDDALPYIERSIRISRKFFSKGSQEQGVHLSNLGTIFFKRNRIAEALDLFREALVNDQKYFGEKHSYVAIRLSNMGSCFVKLQDYNQAMEHYQRALDIDREVHPQNHPDIAFRLNKIGETYSLQNQIDDAKKAFREALSIAEAGSHLFHVVDCNLNKLL